VSALSDWAPRPEHTVGLTTAWSVDAFAALLDVDPPGVVPPLWHWFGFLDHPRQSELGEDGHPAAGRFLPPMPQRRRMIAGGRILVRGLLPVGEQVERHSALRGVEVKQGRSGELVFVTVRHEFRCAGELLCTEEQDVVYRSQAPGQARSLTRPPADPVASPDWRFEVTPDAAWLFRFSALTYNTHRIHYDEPYVTGVEGYPGLVVHGPLLALLLLEIPRRYVPARPVVSFDYRLTTPVFAGETVVVTGRADGDRIVLAAAVPGAASSISGVATLGR
jgi:3-methylfumaryl-CoA hydratase